MPFYTFETNDDDINDKTFSVMLSFSDYDKLHDDPDLLTKKDKDGWFISPGPKHPETELSVKSWRRVLDNVNVNFTNPKESSRWDNFEYRAGHNMESAKQDRRNAESLSHVGANPYQDQEGISGESFVEKDMANFEGRTV